MIEAVDTLVPPWVYRDNPADKIWLVESIHENNIDDLIFRSVEMAEQKGIQVHKDEIESFKKWLGFGVNMALWLEDSIEENDEVELIAGEYLQCPSITPQCDNRIKVCSGCSVYYDLREPNIYTYCSRCGAEFLKMTWEE